MENNNQLTVIDRSIDVFRGGSQILINHQLRAQKALAVGESILQQWENAYSIEDPEQRMLALSEADKRSNQFLANCGVAISEMQESRKAITQLMDTIKKMFIEEESKVDVKKDGIPSKIQDHRNKYARLVAEEEERRRKEAELKAAKAKEEVEIRTMCEKIIGETLVNYLFNRKQLLTKKFNEITLDDIEERSEKLKAMAVEFPKDAVLKLLPSEAGYISTKHHTLADVQDIYLKVQGEYNYDTFLSQYKREISDLKQQLIDQLPSKRAELEDQKRRAEEAERLRQEELRRQEEAERRRQEELRKAKDEEERKRKEEEARREREEEAERLAALEREAREKEEAAKREQEERERREKERLEREAEEARKKMEEEREVQKASATAAVLFDQVEESTVTAEGPEARTSVEIDVTHPAGWVEIFQFWFMHEGCKMKAADMGKKSLNQMKTYVEKVAKTSGERITSKYLTYRNTVKAVNRKTVA